jgi:hypothetical protein
MFYAYAFNTEGDRMDGWIDGWMDGWVGGWMDG